MKRPKMGYFCRFRASRAGLFYNKNCWVIFNDKKELLGDYLENIGNYVKTAKPFFKIKIFDFS